MPQDSEGILFVVGDWGSGNSHYFSCPNPALIFSNSSVFIQVFPKIWMFQSET